MARKQRKVNNSFTAASAKKPASEVGSTKKIISTLALQDKKRSEEKSPPQQKDTKGSENRFSPQHKDTKGSEMKSPSQQKVSNESEKNVLPQQKKTAESENKSYQQKNTKESEKKAPQQQKNTKGSEKKSNLKHKGTRGSEKKSHPQQKNTKESEKKALSQHSKNSKESKKKSPPQSEDQKAANMPSSEMPEVNEGRNKIAPAVHSQAQIQSSIEGPAVHSREQVKSSSVCFAEHSPEQIQSSSESPAVHSQAQIQSSNEGLAVHSQAQIQSSNEGPAVYSRKQVQSSNRSPSVHSSDQIESSEGPAVHSREQVQSNEGPAVHSSEQVQSSSEGPAVPSRRSCSSQPCEGLAVPSREQVESHSEGPGEHSCEVCYLSCSGHFNKCVAECYERTNKFTERDLTSFNFAQEKLTGEQPLQMVTMISTELITTAFNSPPEDVIEPVAIFPWSSADDEVVTKAPYRLLEQRHSLAKEATDHNCRDQVSSENSVPCTNNPAQSNQTKIQELKAYDRDTLLMIEQLPISHEQPEYLKGLCCVRKNSTHNYGKSKSDMTENTPQEINGLPSIASFVNLPSKRNLANRAGNQTSRKIIEVRQTSKANVLKTTDNAWKPVSKSGANADQKVMILRSITSVLNKICPENYDKLKDGFRETILSNEDYMPDIINVIHDKAVIEKHFSAEYAALCQYVVDANPNLPSKQQSSVVGNFKRSLLVKCQHEFEDKFNEEANRQKDMEHSLQKVANCKSSGIDEILEKTHRDEFVDKERIKQFKLQSELEGCTDEAQRRALAKEFEDLECNSRRKSVGLIKFVAELFRVKLLTQKTILNLHLKLVDAIHNALLAEMLYTLFLTIGKDLWLILTEEEQQQFRKMLDKIRKYVSVTQDNRIKFLLQDVLDLFDAGFVARHKSHQKVGPTTKKEVHEKMLAEQLQSEQEVLPLFESSRGNSEHYRCDNRKLTSLGNADRDRNCEKLVTMMNVDTVKSTPSEINREPSNASCRRLLDHRNVAAIQTNRKIIEARQTSNVTVLKTADNAWKPVSKSGANADQKVMILRAITSVLNKICPENYNKLKDGFRETILSNEDHMSDIINVILDKAVLEKHFSAEYAALCQHVVDPSTKLPSEQKSSIACNFKRSLLGKCQHEFEKKLNEEANRREDVKHSLKNIASCKNAQRKAILEKEHSDEFVDKLRIRQVELQSLLKDCKEEAKRKELSAQIEDLESCSRRKSVGLIKFVAELFRVKLLPHKAILDLHLKLVHAIHKALLAEMLCTFFITLGKDLWLTLEKGEKQQFSKSIDKIRKFVGVTKDIRIKFLLKDVLDLFDAGFVALHKSQQKVGPTTKKEVAAKMEVEQYQFEQKVLSVSNCSRDKKKIDRIDNRKNTPLENSDQKSQKRFSEIIKADDTSKRPTILKSIGIMNTVPADENLTLRPSSQFSSWSNGSSAGEKTNVCNSRFSSMWGSGASSGCNEEVHNSGHHKYAYGNVGGGVRASEVNAYQIRLGTGNSEMRNNGNSKSNQNNKYGGQQQDHFINKFAPEPHFTAASVMKPLMIRANPFRSSNTADNLAGRRSRGNTQEENHCRAKETISSICPTNYSYRPDNMSRSVTPARSNSPQRPAVHPPTAPSSGFSQPSMGLTNSAHSDDHIHDDGDDEKLKELCNIILHEFYDSKNIEEAVEEISRKVGTRKIATFLGVALLHCTETKPANGGLSSALVAELFTRKIASAKHITEMLKPATENFADLSLDIPQLATYLAPMFNNLLRAGAFSLAEVWTLAQSTGYQKHKLFLSVVKSLAFQDAEEARMIWDASNLTWDIIFTLEEGQRPFDVEEQLQQYNLSYLSASGRGEEKSA